MKNCYLLVLLAFCSTTVFSQTIFTYGNAAVDKEEFLRAYNKNKTPVTDKEKSVREYLDLYVKFKLKVKAARDLQLDTLAQLKNDLEGFRTQIQDSYLSNETAINALIDEAFLRSQEDLHVIHFFISLDASLKPGDSAKAYSALNDVPEMMRSNNNDFEKVTKLLSEKYTTTKSADLGFITVFSLPYEYENMVYALHPGETSKIYRSKKGLHIFTLLEKRKSTGKWKVAQILLAFPPGDQSESFKMIRQKADSIYTLLKRGADFSDLAMKISDDKMTFMAGGEMPEFSTGKFDLSFEKEVFKLSKDGEISQPFPSQFGFHIVKRIKLTPTPSDKSESLYLSELKQKVMQDSRANTAREIFLKDVIKQVGVKKTAIVKDADLFRYADTVAANLSKEVSKKIPVYDKVIYTIGKNNIRGADWLNYIHEYKNTPELYQGENNATLLDKFVSATALDYYKKRLEEYNTDFRYQMDEFRDGNILFEIMERNVWSKAANDTIGLANYYSQNKSKYKWAPSAAIIIFNCSNKTVADQAINALKNGKDWRKIMEEQNSGVQADSGRYELSQISMEKEVTPKAGLITDPVVNQVDGTANFIKFITLYDGGLQRSFDEARGLVINDYQSVIEDRWLNELKKKYPVKINEAVLQTLIR
jgi:peptidyl-prolyl cis-trans isomerase SurA